LSKWTTGSRSGAWPSSRLARRQRWSGFCHTLNRVNTVWLKQKTVHCPTWGKSTCYIKQTDNCDICCKGQLQRSWFYTSVLRTLCVYRQ
jgi:hypothetical protein